MKRFVWFLLAATCLPLFVASCNPSPEPQPTIPTTPTPTATPVPEGLYDITFEFSLVRTHPSDTRELAVAFNKLQFLDYDDQITGELSFGTGDENIVLGEGWWENERWNDTFPFQWAGTQAMQASIQILMPENTEALLLRVNGTEAGVWMNVKVNGESVADLRVDAYWHLAYVPIGPPGDPIPVSGDIQWDAGRYFPDFPDSDHLYAFPVRHPLQEHTLSWQAGWRANQSYDAMMALSLVGMQGLINRGVARVYLDWQDQWERSAFWIPRIDEVLPVTFFDFDSLSTVNFLMRRFGDRFAGAVRYDPEVPDTINLATMLAGLEDRLILTNEQEGMPGFPALASVKDICTEVGIEYCDQTQLEENKIELYRWAYQELWPRLNHRLIGLISPGPPTSEEIPGTQAYLPLGLASRDYAIALKLPVLWLAPPDVADFPSHCPPYQVEIPPGSEAELFAAFLEEAESPIALYGFYGASEAGTVAMASLYGDHVPVLTNSNAPISASNLTVFTSLGLEHEPLTGSIDYDRLYAALSANHVFTLFSSDGDNIQFLMDRGFHGWANFLWENVQGHRFGWTINPTLSEVAPFVWNNYVSSRDEVSMVAGLSGAGYTYPQLMDDVELAGYLEYASRYLSETGIGTLHVSERYGLWDQVAEEYYTKLPAPGFLGTFVNLSGWPWSPGFYYAGVPSPAVKPAYVVTPDNGDEIITDILSRAAGEVFIDLAGDHAWYWDNQAASSYLWHRGEEACLDTDCMDQALHFSINDAPLEPAVWGPFATLMPGDYKATYRMKIADNTSSSDVVGIVVTRSYGCEQTQFASDTIKANQFNQRDIFQDFTVEFSLDRPTNEIEFQLDYYGIAGLHLDTIYVVRQEKLDLPLFASGFIPLTWPGEMRDVPELADDMQAAGVLVLTPDEFMASVNPEFMTNWAMQVMGLSHPEVSNAVEFLDSGNFFDSLLAARRALGLQPRRTFDRTLGIGCEVSVTANTWITALNFDLFNRQLSFNAHGYPQGTVRAEIFIPDACTPDPLPEDAIDVLVDEQSVPYSVDRETYGLGKSTGWKIAFQFPQGEHRVVVTGQ